MELSLKMEEMETKTAILEMENAQNSKEKNWKS